MTDTELQQKAVTRKNPFMYHNFMEIEHVERDLAVLRLKVRPESLNPHGMIGGGLMSALADNATAEAAHTDGRLYVSQNCSFYFVNNQSEGVIRATAKVKRRGRSVVLVDVEVAGENDKLLAAGIYTLFCVSETGGPSSAHS